MAPVIESRGLVVRYGEVVAVDGLDVEAAPGKVLALLGPNGAGKTSTVETLEGYRRPDGGTVRVLGFDPVLEHRELVSHIGVMLQRGGVYPTMSARRVLELFSHYYEHPQDLDQLIDQVGLRAVEKTPWKRLSGGEQQRLSLALALVGCPAVLFLDEPTAGVDPEGRMAVRAVVDAERKRGTCVLLTTHELPEAERLADEVVILSFGRVVARGSVEELAQKSREEAIHFSAPAGADLGSLAGALGVEPGAVTEDERGRYSVKAPATPERLAALAGWLSERDLPLVSLSAGQTSLEHAYLDAVRGAAATSDSPDGSGGVLAPPLSGSEETAPAHERPGAARGRPVSHAPIAQVARRVHAQSRAEVEMTLRRGESVLLTLGIPVILLLFFSEVHVLPVGTRHPVEFLAPGILALAVMGTAMVNLSIATGFERGYGVLKRLGATPLGRPSLVTAKIAAVVVVEVLQVAVLVPVALGLGWHPTPGGSGEALAVVLLGTAGLAGVGLLLAGTLRAEVNLAAANALWLLLLLSSGMLVPISRLPGWLEAIAKLLPSAALSSGLHSSLGLGVSVPAWAWVTLAFWAVAAPALAAATFRWE